MRRNSDEMGSNFKEMHSKCEKIKYIVSNAQKIMANGKINRKLGQMRAVAFVKSNDGIRLWPMDTPSSLSDLQ